MKKSNQVYSNIETEIIDLLTEERRKQLSKWGNPDLTHSERCMILGEEFGEVCQAAHDLTFADQFPEHCKGDIEGLKKELIQVAAVAVAWLEGL